MPPERFQRLIYVNCTEGGILGTASPGLDRLLVEGVGDKGRDRGPDRPQRALKAGHLQQHSGLRLPSVMKPVGIVYRPEIQGPNRLPVPHETRAAIHKRIVGSPGINSFARHRMTTLLNLVHVIADTLVQVHKVVWRDVLLLTEYDCIRRIDYR